MGRVCDVPRPLSELVRELLALSHALPTALITDEKLAGWRTDPDIIAHLATLTKLQLDFLVDCRDVDKGRRSGGVGDDEGADNLAHLLGFTSELKTLSLRPTGRGQSKGKPRIPSRGFGLVLPPHPSLP